MRRVIHHRYCWGRPEIRLWYIPWACLGCTYKSTYYLFFPTIYKFHASYLLILFYLFLFFLLFRFYESCTCFILPFYLWYFHTKKKKKLKLEVNFFVFINISFVDWISTRWPGMMHFVVNRDQIRRTCQMNVWIW